jgi:hypothetical protein
VKHCEQKCEASFYAVVYCPSKLTNLGVICVHTFGELSKTWQAKFGQVVTVARDLTQCEWA